MRLLDRDDNKALKRLGVYLTIEEANEMVNDLNRLIKNFGSNEHTHINDLQYDHEITLVVYSENNLDGFDERSKILIKDDF